MRYYRSVAAAGVLLALGLASTAAGQTGPRPPVPADLFRKPAGSYAIGTRDYLWIDESRGEPLTKDPGDKRHLMVQIWYPADSVSGAEPAPYIRNPDEFGEFTVFKPVLHVRTNAVIDAPLAKAERRYPVLVYHHGGSWTRFSATFETEWLTSHGYVVVSVDHTGFNKTALFPRRVPLSPRHPPVPDADEKSSRRCPRQLELPRHPRLRDLGRRRPVRAGPARVAEPDSG